MKIAILGDTHFGCRNDLMLFHDSFRKFYTDVFFPKLQEQGITTVFQLGDLFDRRKYINFQSLAECKDYFFDELEKRNIQLTTLIGNHDIYWRESLSVNSTSLVLGEYKNINVVDKPITIRYTEDDTTYDVIPWICPENESEVISFINQSKSDICMGHFEITGFSMYRGMDALEGLNRDMFAKYEQVWSGHYHTRSKQGNITYVGTPAEMTWQDFNDPKGFHIFNTATRELTFIKNPYTSYARLDYDDTKEVPSLDDLDLANKYVKVVVVDKSDLYKFDLFMNKLYSKGCYEIKIIEDMKEFNDGEIGEEINLEDTLSILSHYIDSVNTDQDKDKIKTYMRTLYTEAINLGSD